MSSPQPPSPENKPLGFDEFIAIAVAFSVIGSIFVWVAGKKDSQLGFTLPLLTPAPPQSSPQLENPQTLTPDPTPSPVPSPTKKVSPATLSPNPATVPVTPPKPISQKPVPAVPLPVISKPAASSAKPVATTSAKGSPIKFSDVPSNYWARPFIEPLTERKIITGFRDGTFRPEEPMTRAEFAAILQGVKSAKISQSPVKFKDVKTDYWAMSSIEKAVQVGFLKGYPSGVFRPEETIPRVQVFAALANGLGLKTTNQPTQTLTIYQDYKQVPTWATQGVAAATEADIVVNFPNRKMLNPNRPATRADVAAMIYQALVKLGKAEPQSSQYVARP